MADLLDIGIIYPLHGAEDDYYSMADMLVPPVELRFAHTEAVDLHMVEMCLDTGSREHVLRFALENDHPDAQAVLIPDTALHTVAFLSELEAHLGKTVLTANQVTMWEALRLAGRLTPQSNLGRLLESTPQPRGLTGTVECRKGQ